MRKNLILSAGILILITFWICNLLAAQNDVLGPLPADVSGAKNSDVKTYLLKISELPGSVKNAMPIDTHQSDLKMADSGKPWNKTDLVTDSSLPFRRLIWATEVNKHFVVHYEIGGIAYGTRFLIFSPEDKNGERTLEWKATAREVAKDFGAFLKMVADGKIPFHSRMHL
jgi:hypothetical protein